MPDDDDRRAQGRSGPFRAARQACYAARDAFYACLDDHAQDPKSKPSAQLTHAGEAAAAAAAAAAVPRQCRALRSKYEKACAASWVKHFDEARGQKKRIEAIMREQKKA